MNTGPTENTRFCDDMVLERIQSKKIEPNLGHLHSSLDEECCDKEEEYDKETERQHEKLNLMWLRKEEVDQFFEKRVIDRKRILDEKRAKVKHDRIKEKWLDRVGEDFFTIENYSRIIRDSGKRFRKLDWESDETNLIDTELFEQDEMLMLRTTLYWGEGESEKLILPLTGKTKIARKWKCELCDTKEWEEKWRYDRHCKSNKHKLNTGEIKPIVKVKKTWKCELCNTEEWEEKWRYDRHRKGKRCLKKQEENTS